MYPMAVTSRAVQAVLVGLALALAGSLVWGFWQWGEARVLQTANKSAQADLASLRVTLAEYEAQGKSRARTDARHAQARAKHAKTVRDVRNEIDTEGAKHAEEQSGSCSARAVARDDELDRLRRLADAGNAGIRAASELP